MSKSSAVRANNNARRIANRISIPYGATERFSPADAQKFAREHGADPYLLEDANFSYLAEILNSRMSPRKTKSRPEFRPYPSPQLSGSVLDVYRAPNHDPVRPRREPEVRYNFNDPNMGEAWRG